MMNKEIIDILNYIIVISVKLIFYVIFFCIYYTLSSSKINKNNTICYLFIYRQKQILNSRRLRDVLASCKSHRPRLLHTNIHSQRRNLREYIYFTTRVLSARLHAHV